MKLASQLVIKRIPSSSTERQYFELTFDEFPSFSHSTTYRNKLVVRNDTAIPLNSSGKPEENF